MPLPALNQMKVVQLFRLLGAIGQKKNKTKNKIIEFFSFLFETVDMDEKFYVLSIGAIVNPLLTSC